MGAVLASALGDVRASTQCEYTIPQNNSVDLAAVKVFIDKTSLALARVADADACDPKTGGFHYDVPLDGAHQPHSIILCPASCAFDLLHTIRVACN